MEFKFINKNLNKDYRICINTRSITVYDNDKEVFTTATEIGI